MKKIIYNLFALGIGLMGLSITSINDLLIKYLYKCLNISYEELNVNIAFFSGLLIILIAVFLFIFISAKERTLSIIGLDSIKCVDKIKNANVINIIKNIKNLNKKNSKAIIEDYINDIEKHINNYFSYGVSYFGVAPLPFIALAGVNYRKIGIISHYEYYQKNDKIKSLNYIPGFLCQRLKKQEEINNNDTAIVTIETTARINENDLKQFNSIDIYKFYLKNPKTNAIFSEYQLEGYSEKIADEIYKISKTNVRKIYILAAAQSSLIFEIFRKLNQNRIKEIVVCNYSINSIPKYNWGIIISGKNLNNYVEMGCRNETNEQKN